MAKQEKGPKYKPEYAERLPEMFSEGQDVLEVCKALGIHRSCFYQWVDKYPEFKAAYELAKEASHAWWHERLRIAVTEGLPSGSAPVLIFCAKAKLGMIEKQHIEHSSPDGSMTPTRIVIESAQADDNGDD